MKMMLMYSFENLEPAILEQVGGKGLSPIELIKRGYYVPLFVILTTKFFNPWIKMLSSTSEWDNFHKATDENLSLVAEVMKKECQTLTFTESQRMVLHDLGKFISNSCF
jgi:phosphoenolpyruvate synthase/pyruvate phosphate dikinase